MKQGQSPLKFEDYEKLAHWATRQLVVRGLRSGANLDPADVFQEVGAIWTHCVSRFDPSHNTKFSTYFVRAVFHEYAAILRRQLGKNWYRTSSLNESVRDNHQSLNHEMELGEIIADDKAPDPELEMMRSDQAARMLERNPLLRRLAQIALRPDAEMRRELQALQAQRDYANASGLGQIEDQAPVALNLQMVAHAVGLNWRSKQIVLQSLEVMT